MPLFLLLLTNNSEVDLASLKSVWSSTLPRGSAPSSLNRGQARRTSLNVRLTSWMLFIILVSSDCKTRLTNQGRSFSLWSSKCHGQSYTVVLLTCLSRASLFFCLFAARTACSRNDWLCDCLSLSNRKVRLTGALTKTKIAFVCFQSVPEEVIYLLVLMGTLFPSLKLSKFWNKSWTPSSSCTTLASCTWISRLELVLDQCNRAQTFTWIWLKVVSNSWLYIKEPLSCLSSYVFSK